MSSYTANALNQYSQRTVPGYAGVRGSATNTATVTVNGNTAWRLGEYFYGGDDADNTASAVMKELDVTAVVNPPGTNTPDLVQSVTGKVFVAKSPEAFTHDEDGNLTQDGRFVYTWDGENRLVGVETRGDLPASVPRVKVAYQYDPRSRRIGKQSYTLATDHWTLITGNSFTYDGWNLIRELTHTQTHTLTNLYTWGLDLSGSLQGAGGVGGLLAVVKDSATYVPAFDGNGNVTEYTSVDGSLVAHYEYSPFGETVIQSGSLADAFSFRFSTKYWEDEVKLYYYGFRFYSTGYRRWLNRDPIWERGGVNLYASCQNNPIVFLDFLGLETEPDQSQPTIPQPNFMCKCENTDIMNELNKKMREAGRATYKDVVSVLIGSAGSGGGMISRKLEYGGYICCNPDTRKVTSTGPDRGAYIITDAEGGETTTNNEKLLRRAMRKRYKMQPTMGNVTDDRNTETKCPAPTVAVAFYHSHPDNGLYSPGDQGYSNRKKIPVYLVTQEGTVQFISDGKPSEPYPIPPEQKENK